MCTNRCDGAAKRANGVIPRCLYLQPGNTNSKDSSTNQAAGAIVVGLNPGRSVLKERVLYKGLLRQGEPLYAKTVEYLEVLFRTEHYYKATEGFVRSLCRSLYGEAWSGPLLWTELAKCELAEGQKHVPKDMATTCSRRFLSRELEAAPPEWPVFAIGRQAYDAACLMSPRRAVIGVPHTTGSWHGAFAQLCKASAKETKEAKVMVKHIVEEVVCSTGTSWLPKDVELRKERTRRV